MRTPERTGVFSRTYRVFIDQHLTLSVTKTNLLPGHPRGKMWPSVGHQGRDTRDEGASRRSEAAGAASLILAERLIELSGRERRSQLFELLSGLHASHGRTGNDPEMPENQLCGNFGAT